MSSHAIAPGIQTVSRIRGVRGVVLTSLADALPIEWRAHVDVDIDALAAFATALHRRAHAVADCSDAGEVHRVSLDAADGRLILASRGDLLVAVLADREAHPGLLRMALQRALEGLA